MIKSNFEQIKQFFIDRQDTHVYYTVETENLAYKSSWYFTPPPHEDVFCVQFTFDHGIEPSRPKRKGGYFVDSNDSFVFNFYIVNYGDRIEVTDFNREWECNVEAFEGNELMGMHFDLVNELVTGKEFYPLCRGYDAQTEIHKVTSPESVAADAIELVRLMLLINHMTDDPPHIKENAQIKRDVKALQKSWL